jgi:hypothetical protein
MDAQKAFERFEKTGAGLLPVFLLAALAIASTLSVVGLSNRVPRIPPELTEAVMNLGRLVSYMVDLSGHTKLVGEDSLEFEEAQEARLEIESSLPENKFKWIGAIQDSREPSDLVPVFLGADRTIYACFVPSKGIRVAGDPSYVVVLTSKTKNDRTIQTCSSEVFNIVTPWSQIQTVDASGDLGKIFTQTLEAHRQQIGSEQLSELDSNIVKFEREQMARTAYWLIEQAPIKSSVVSEMLGRRWRGDNEVRNALLLIGFCKSASEEYDHAALKAYLQNNGSSNESEAETTNGFYVLHAMSNEMHVAKMFPQSISQAEIRRRLQSEWLPATVQAGKTDMAQVEKLMKELTQSDPLVLVGEIEKPFRAKIYQRSSTKKSDSAKNTDSNVDAKEITK